SAINAAMNWGPRLLTFPAVNAWKAFSAAPIEACSPAVSPAWKDDTVRPGIADASRALSQLPARACSRLQSEKELLRRPRRRALIRADRRLGVSASAMLDSSTVRRVVMGLAGGGWAGSRSLGSCMGVLLWRLEGAAGWVMRSAAAVLASAPQETC